MTGIGTTVVFSPMVWYKRTRCQYRAFRSARVGDGPDLYHLGFCAPEQDHSFASVLERLGGGRSEKCGGGRRREKREVWRG
eukprot:432086-Rhodomonas_salina.1